MALNWTFLYNMGKLRLAGQASKLRLPRLHVSQRGTRPSPGRAAVSPRLVWPRRAVGGALA